MAVRNAAAIRITESFRRAIDGDALFVRRPREESRRKALEGVETSVIQRLGKMETVLYCEQKADARFFETD
jgi:hypothetical protein